MAVEWTQHRFTGGVLALDTTNTVVLRNDPARRFDRFDDPAEIARFADAASLFRSAELGGRRLSAADPAAIRGKVLAMREAADAAFRGFATAGAMQSDRLARMLAACADGVDGGDERVMGAGAPFGDPARPIDFEAALAVSAISLLAADRLRRVRICANCSWLFLDNSRNASRVWCDMAVCGNRQKAKRHYMRHRALERGGDNV
jgi:predicted RNA-binding Zn ribbon-like protein